MLLTVIIVTKNPGVKIHSTLSSLQSLDDTKVEILMKDNSSDKKLARINEVFNFTNFRYIHAEDDGVYDAMNQAIQLAKGEFLYFLNAGDQYVPCSLLSTIKESSEEIDFFYGNVIVLSPFVRIIKYSRFLNKYSVYITGICHQGLVFRRKVFDALGSFDKNLKIHADYLFTLNLVDNYKGQYLKKFIALYKGEGISYKYKLPAGERKYLNSQLKNVFNALELKVLQLISILVSWIVYVKNINKPT